MKKKLFSILYFSCFMSMVYANDPSAKWSSNPFEHKFFIENKGQFEIPGIKNSSEILFGVHNGKYKIYFCKDGLYYKIEKPFAAERNKFIDHFKFEQEEHTIFKSEYIHYKFQNSNPEVELITADLSATYFNYASDKKRGRKAISGAKAYSKLVYKNLYPGIDAEYVFHEKEGIKYSFILAPNADPSLISLGIEGAKNTFVDGDGNLHVQGEYAEILDYKPLSFASNELKSANKKEILSTYNLIKNKFSTSLSFNIGDYDASKGLIIDPWEIIPTDLEGALKAFEIKRGEGGNAYVYGGFRPYNVVKYDTKGQMLWVYETAGADFAGDLAVDPQGTVYVTTYSEFSKLDKAGNEIFQKTGPIREQWRLDFNCNYTKLVLGGGENGGTFYEFNFKTNIFNAPKNVTGNEIRSMASAPNGYFYALTLTTVITGNTFIGADKTYKLKFTQPSNYPMQYYGALYANGLAEARCPINGVVADQNFVYTTDGGTMTKWTLSGGKLADVLVFGGSAEGNGGIAVDSCGNIYVGSKTSVIKYDSTLTQVGEYPTAGTVYDVSLGLNGEIFASGQAFAGAFAAGACGDVPCCPIITGLELKVLPNCNAADGSIEITPVGGVAPYKFKWNSIPVQTTTKAINLKSGEYVCEITDANGCVGIVTVFLESKSGMVSTLDSVKNVSCFGRTDGLAIVSGSGGSGTLSYEWNSNPAQFSSTLLNVPAGDYICTVKDANQCAIEVNATISEPLALTSKIDQQKDLNCKNDSTGEAAVNGIGGNGPYAYSWNTQPAQSTSRAVGLKAGEYECTVTDSKGCTVIQKVTIPEKDGVTIVLQGNPDCYGSEIGTIDAIVNGGTPPYTYAWETVPVQTNSTASGLPKGTYRVAVTDNSGCSLNSEYYVLDCPSILIPDGFNPKSVSDKNTTFKPIAKLYKNYSMKIFDRWGKEVFESTDYNLGWDGKYIKTQIDCPVGVYIYQINVEDANGKSKSFNGHFSLTE